MARPRPSNGVTVDQVLDYLLDCSFDDLMYVAQRVAHRRSDALDKLAQQQARLSSQIEMLKAFDLSAVRVPE